MALLFWAPLPFGSNRPWAAALLFLLTALLFCGWLLLFLLGKARVEAGHWQQLRWPLALLGGVQVWILLQTLPLPRELVAWLSPAATDLHLPAAYVPLSLDVAASRYMLLQGLSCTLVFALVTLLVRERDRISALLWTIVASGAFQASYGTMMTLSGLEYGFFVEKYVGLGLATGTFINRNHLAAYLVIALSAGIGLLISRLDTTESAATLRARLRSLLTLLLSSKLLLRLLLAVMVIGLVLTRSRMGNVSFFVALTVAGSIILLGNRQWQSGKLALLLTSLLLVDLLIVGRWFGADEVAERLMQTSTATESRDEVSTYSLGIIRDYPLTGAGAGTFYTVFPRYSQVELKGDYYTHAHNDVVELAGDLGVPALLALIGVVLMALARAFYLQYHSDSRLARGISFTLLMLIGWAALHSLVDFNFYIPANSFTFAVVLALAWIDPHAIPGKNRRISRGLR